MIERIAMTKESYMDCLKDLMLALAQKHGEMTVRAMHERVNQAIIDFGIDKSPDTIRAGVHS